VVGIEQAHDLMQSFSPMVIPEYFRMDEWVTIAKICGKLHFGVLCILPANKASDKPDNDHVPNSGRGCHGTASWKEYFLALHDARRHKNHRAQNNMRTKLPTPTVLHGDFSQFVIQRATPKRRRAITLTMYRRPLKIRINSRSTTSIALSFSVGTMRSCARTERPNHKALSICERHRAGDRTAMSPGARMMFSRGLASKAHGRAH